MPLWNTRLEMQSVFSARTFWCFTLHHLLHGFQHHSEDRCFCMLRRQDHLIRWAQMEIGLFLGSYTSTSDNYWCAAALQHRNCSSPYFTCRAQPLRSHSRSVFKFKFSAKAVVAESSEKTISAVITRNSSSNYRDSIKGQFVTVTLFWYFK